MSRVSALMLTLTVVITVEAQGGDGQREFWASDLFELQFASDPQINRAGSVVAYVRTRYQIETDKPATDIWLVDVATHAQRPLVGGVGQQSTPRWSPEGKRLAYIAVPDEGKPALWVRTLGSELALRVAELAEAPSDLVWSPDGKWLAFVAWTADPPASSALGLTKPEGATWAAPVRTFSKVEYRFDGRGYLAPGFFHVFLVSAAGGTPRQVTFGPFNDANPFSLSPLGSLSWTPDGKFIVFSAHRAANWERNPFNSDIYRLSVADGTLTALTVRFGPDSEPAVSPDGRLVAYTGYDDNERAYENTQLYLMDRDGHARRSLTSLLDRTIGSPQWASDGRSLYFSFVDHGVTKIGRVFTDGKLESVAEGLAGATLDRPYSGGSFSVSDTGVIAFTIGDTGRPPDVAVLRNGRVQRLTDLNALLGRRISFAVSKQSVVRSSYDGRLIDTWMLLPPRFDPKKRYPLILEIHGGPIASYGPVFASELQLYAAAGYVVVYANPRGSSSYGEQFANLITRAYPGHDYEDLMSVVDAAVGTGSVDPERLYVTGGSGGGVLTAWIVGKTDRFRAAVVQKPIVNWVSGVLTSDAYTILPRYFFGKMPWEDPDAYWRRSPLSLVGHVSTPTMLLVGDDDVRSPPSEAEQYYQALQLRGVPTALVKVPAASHSSLAARPSQQAAEVEALLAWFAGHR